MSRVIIACANGTPWPRAMEWATHEASLRDLPLEVRYDTPPNHLTTAAMLVLDLTTAEDNATDLVTSPTALALTAASACPVVLIPDALVSRGGSGTLPHAGHPRD